MLDPVTFNLPSPVLQHLMTAIGRMDTDHDDCLSYIEFLCVLRFMSCFSQLENISEQDIEECRPHSVSFNDVILMTNREATEWCARIYHKKEFEDVVLKPAMQNQKDLMSNTDTDLESIVNYWDLDDIVEEVFNEELEAAGTEEIDGEEDENEAGAPGTPTERKRKRDIVKRAFKHIVHHERGSTRRMIRQKWQKLMTPTTPTTPTTPVEVGQQAQMVV